ncbi:hypothetical protein Tco_0748305 [Tanacetum coccineum]|uniref:Retrovirus-related Pol polyprotein from transposon TNT 1-94 n=1 Tax=Tanacetum coccineum TaxID=301880 RepID=A0ABQ4YVD1_9ASTR
MWDISLHDSTISHLEADHFTALRLNGSGKTIRDKENTIIRNKSRLVVRDRLKRKELISKTHLNVARLGSCWGAEILLGIQIHQSPRLVFYKQSYVCYRDTKQAWYDLSDSIGTPMATKRLEWLTLSAFLDLDHAGCLDSRKSTSGGIQFLGGDKLVSWSSKKQDCTSMSSAEAEYVSLSACCRCNAAIAISCNPVQHSRTKHIDVRYHFIKEQVEKGIVELFFVGTEYQLADLFTKALSEDRFKSLVRQLGMRCLTPDELEVLAIESA